MIVQQLLVAVSLCALTHAAAPDLPPAAQVHHDQAILYVDADDYLAAAAELELAYAAMPDPVLHRAGRGTIAGTLRGVLMHLYDTTHDPAHLLRLRDLFSRHRDALQAALGPSATPEDTAGTQRELDRLDAELERIQPPPLLGAGTASASPVEATPPPPAPNIVPPLHPPADAQDTRARRRRRVGGALLGSVALPLAAALAGTGVYVDRYRLIAAFDHALDASGQLATDDQRARVAALNHQGVVARGVAIAAGTAAGVLLVTGVAVLATGRRPAKQLGVAPTFTPSSWGLGLRGRF